MKAGSSSAIARLPISCALADPSALAGRTDHDFYPVETADAFRAMEKGVIEDGKALVNYDERHTTPSGAVAPDPDHQGRPTTTKGG